MPRKIHKPTPPAAADPSPVPEPPAPAEPLRPAGPQAGLYRCVCGVICRGKHWGINEELRLTAEEAASLLAQDAIEPVL